MVTEPLVVYLISLVVAFRLLVLLLGKEHKYFKTGTFLIIIPIINVFMPLLLMGIEQLSMKASQKSLQNADSK